MTQQSSQRFGLTLVALLLFCFGLASAQFMESHGHIVTGMDNQIVWGLPHVFAIFLIVAASGALNVASIGTVFNQAEFKPWAGLSGLLAISLLAGGLMVLLLDLGRPERVLIAATHFNLSSVFAWNVLLYSGFFTLVAFYLWCALAPAMHGWRTGAGLAAFTWRLILTTGTGCIFAFISARQAYSSAILPPLFIILSLSWGQAVFLLVARLLGRPIAPELNARLARLTALFTLLALYLVALLHGVNFYFARQAAFEQYLLFAGAPWPLIFWLGYVLLGALVPTALLLSRRCARWWLAACILIVLGGGCWLYVFVIGGQSFPLEIFPGYAVASSFADGQINTYQPSLAEALLGLGGVGLALFIMLIGVRLLPFLPRQAQLITTAANTAP